MAYILPVQAKSLVFWPFIKAFHIDGAIRNEICLNFRIGSPPISPTPSRLPNPAHPRSGLRRAAFLFNKKRKADMKTLKEQIQLRLAEKKLKKQQTIPSRPPRYDEVFFEGVRWLDSLAGEPVEPQEGEITFSKTIWKSPARTVPDVSRG
jgi:hypothetical protein